MGKSDSFVHVSNTHVEAEEAIRTLAKSGLDVRKLSLIGKGYHSEEHPLGFYTANDKIKAWGGIWGFLLAPAIFFIPGLGLIARVGPLVAALVGALEGAVVIGGVSALGAALSQMGVPKDQIIKYETDLKADTYILVVHGGDDEVERARSVLEHSKSWNMTDFLEPINRPSREAITSLC